MWRARRFAVGVAAAAVGLTIAAHTISGGSPVTMGFLGACLAESGRRDEAEAFLAQLLPEERSVWIPPTAPAFILAALGRTDEAFVALDEAANERDSMLCYARVMPAYAPLRDDARFSRLLQRIGLQERDSRSRPLP